MTRSGEAMMAQGAGAADLGPKWGKVASEDRMLRIGPGESTLPLLGVPSTPGTLGPRISISSPPGGSQSAPSGQMTLESPPGSDQL